jgi:predicted nucleic acid-binding Zn ribbon protein
MSGEEKRQRLDALQRRSNELSKRIAERVGEDF